MIKFLIPIFLHFRTPQVFLKYLAKFQSTANSITHVFWTFISENLPPPLNFPCSKSGLRIGENDVIFSNSQPRLGTRKINGGRKPSEKKVQKT